MPSIMPPIYYDDPLEAKTIRQALQKLLDGYFYELKRLQDNQFILTADEPGIAQLEKQFDIIPDLTQEDLEFRRQRLLNRNTTKPPFTLEYLEDKLGDLLGEGSYKINMNYNEYDMDVEVGLDKAIVFREIASTIDMVKPANITKHLTWIRQVRKAHIHLGSAVQTGTKLSVYPRISGGVTARMKAPLKAWFKQGIQMDIYPRYPIMQPQQERPSPLSDKSKA